MFSFFVPWAIPSDPLGDPWEIPWEIRDLPRVTQGISKQSPKGHPGGLPRASQGISKELPKGLVRIYEILYYIYHIIYTYIF